jgi:hypothetical protein
MMPLDEETRPPGRRRARAGRLYELPEKPQEPRSVKAPRPWQPGASPNRTHRLESAILLLFLLLFLFLLLLLLLLLASDTRLKLL